MTVPYERKDNEFIAWYPPAVTREAAPSVWEPAEAAFYIHIPFCTAICDYCGFAVARVKDSQPLTYMDALRREIEHYADAGVLGNYRFTCGHFGGGTPSAVDPAALTGVLDLVRERFEVTADAEITIEVNPISFTLEGAHQYLDAGINRLSFGVQSFNDETLKTIGRPHRRGDVEATLGIIHEVGWENFSIDLIYGVPGQSLADLRADLERVIAAGPAHVSCFRLEIIPFTALHLKERAEMLPERLPVELLNEMDALVSETLHDVGYDDYGSFNFARPGFKSRHNDIAFVAPQAEYIGWGNSSYSFIRDHVFTNHADIYDYVEAVQDGRYPIALARRANALELMSRYFVLGLKFFDVPRGPFIERFGMEPEQVFGDVLERLVAQGLLAREADSYHLTPLGRPYVNNIAKEFYVGENVGARQHVQFVPTLTPEQIEQYAHSAR